GNNPDFAAIRRWTAPQDGQVSIRGTLDHPSSSGDGVRGRIMSSHHGLGGTWTAHGESVATEVDQWAVQAGDHIDFVTDCRGDVNADSVKWAGEISLAAGEDEPVVWKADEGFRGPQSAGPQLVADHIIDAWRGAYCREPL